MSDLIPANERIPDKFPTLLPTPSLSPDEFEDFTERLLHAQKFIPGGVRRVVRAERWGRKGDKQDGIDFEGTWSDGKSAAWQCKRLDNLAAADVKTFVAECTFVADEYYLAFSGEASAAARTEIKKHKNWQILDRRGLGRMLEDLPLHKQRQVLDKTWGTPQRKLLLSVPSEDAFLDIEQVLADRHNADAYLNDLGPMVARDHEVQALDGALGVAEANAPIVLIEGAGGHGKSRLATEALSRHEAENAPVAVMWLAAGRPVDASALAELPNTPAIIVVDDAHRDPEQIVPLLTYVSRTKDAQLVLITRGGGVDPLRNVVYRAGFREAQLEVITLDDLDLKSARSLVASLSTDLSLKPEFLEYLAQQATDAPYIAVLTLSMIRRGELTGSLALDDGLRSQVLAKFEDVLVGTVAGYPPNVVRKFLATFAALGSIDETDEALRASIAAFLKLEVVDYLALLFALKERGAILSRSDRARVIPDVLADQILERQAVISRVDTGFVSEIWDHFADSGGGALIIALASLDWRITQQSGPSVIQPVWDSLHARIDNANLSELRNLVGDLGTLVYIQPTSLFGLLEKVRLRLDQFRTEGIPDEETTEPDASTMDSARIRALLGQPPLVPDEVERLLAPLYGGVAKYDTSLLEHSLDVLWNLAKDDHRPPNQNQDHPRRVIAEQLSDLGQLPDSSFAERIVSRVEEYLEQPAANDYGETPIALLSPFLAKDGHRSQMASRRSISFQPYAISPDAVRALRDRIRVILVTAALGDDSARSAAAVSLLSDAIREPLGYFGRSIEQAEIEVWTEDDEATIESLRSISRETSSPLIRRLIRDAVDWTAEHGHVTANRRNALALIVELDNVGDELADALLHAYSFGLPSFRGRSLADLNEIESEIHDHADINEEAMSRLEQRNTERLHRGAETLLYGRTNEEVLIALREAVSGMRAARLPGTDGVGSFMAYLSKQRPGLAEELALDIAGGQPSDLDVLLPELLHGWFNDDDARVLEWVTNANNHRTAVRSAVAVALTTYGWDGRSPSFSGLLRERILAESDEAIRQVLISGGGRLITQSPAQSIEFLRDAGASDRALTNALHMAARCQPDFTKGISVENTVAVLSTIESTGAQGWDTEELIVRIAQEHPRMVLNWINEGQQRSNKSPRKNQNGRVSAQLHQTPEIVADWLIDVAKEPHRAMANYMVADALGEGLSAATADALEVRLPRLSRPQLKQLVFLLSRLQNWVPLHPGLARHFFELDSSGETDPELSVFDGLRAGMVPSHWSTFGSGPSPELQQALFANRSAFHSETDPAMKAAYSETADRIVAQFFADLESADEDDD